MQPIYLPAGARIFTAGEPSTAVYVVRSGIVAITVGSPLSSVEVARLGPGELFGEFGVLEERSRSASATAITETTLLVTPAQDFLKAFGIDNDVALGLLKTMCRRLHDTTQKAAGTVQPPGGASNCGNVPSQSGPNLIRLIPRHKVLTGRYGLAPIRIDHLPFQVGNRYGGETLGIASNHALTIPAHGAPDLSAPHFEILRRDGILGVRDLCTARGTIVNGTPLGRTSLTPFAKLRAGENELIAGAADSPFRFQVEVTG